MTRLIFLLLVLTSALGVSQQKLSKVLKRYNTESIPYITVDSLKQASNNVYILDSREAKEYATSHLKNAIHVGYNHFNIGTVQKNITDKNSQIVVYCSLGVRSEDIAEKLKDAGYTQVKNLYGGIFEWKNHDLPVYNQSEQQTDSIHAYSKSWGKWLNKGIKVYE